MGKYLYMLFVGMLCMFVTTIPVLATDVNLSDNVFVMGIPNAPPEVLPPDVTIEIAYLSNYSLYLPEATEFLLPISKLIPRPGWQSQAAAEAFNIKRQSLLAEHINI